MAEHDPAGMRLNYDLGTLEDTALAHTPLAQFERWLADAVACDPIVEPNAMVLGTVGNPPSSRSVLMKGIDARGLTFFTNYGSRKAGAIEADPRVTALFPWYPLHRQVAIVGRAHRVSREESAAYFVTRPHLSQLGAMASDQSAAIASRDVLDERMAQLMAQYPEGSAVPLPDNWGGYLITVESMEFWQGRRSRLHDRLRFESLGTGSRLDTATDWRVQRYAP